jgi:hypothetical protein
MYHTSRCDAATAAIEADRASRGAGEPCLFGCKCEKHYQSAPAEPPTGHLEVAVRALDEIRDKRLNKYGDCEGCCRSKQELFVGGHDAYFVCGISSRALAALRAAKGTP